MVLALVCDRSLGASQVRGSDPMPESRLEVEQRGTSAVPKAKISGKARIGTGVARSSLTASDGGTPKPIGPVGFVWVPPGTFVMGSPKGEDPENFDEVQHPVTLTQGFWLSDHEVTQREYRSVLACNPSFYSGDDESPVDMVSWNEAVLYCRTLTQRERAAGRITAGQAYRLPTEAEWEYAARAGTTGPRHGELAAIAWSFGNAGQRTHPVNQKVPNGWGLYDMLGNVSEWCSDWYGAYPSGSLVDHSGPVSGLRRVVRGGSINHNQSGLRFASRSASAQNFRNPGVGFRPVLGSIDFLEPLGLPILTQPEARIVRTGATTAFSVVASGVEPLFYRWQRNGTDLAGETRATLTIADARVTDAGDYQVVVSNRLGSVTSSSARLTVTPVGPVGPIGFAWIPPGTFLMGSPADELEQRPVPPGFQPEQRPDELQHEVTLTQGFWMSDHEVTQGEYHSVVGSNPSYFQGDELRPVEQVNWGDAVLYCQKLTDRERAAGRISMMQAYRLPTEAEWEYAARAGTRGPLYEDFESLGKVAWYRMERSNRVGKKLPNAWGLHDMLGNVGEWCLDWHGEYPSGSVTDPMGPASGSSRVLRGGSWLFGPVHVRLAVRLRIAPESVVFDLGFRPVLSPATQDVPVGPTILFEPESLTVVAGQSVRLHVTVHGAAPLTYQWSFNGVDLMGAIGETMLISDVRGTNAGDYRVVVSNAFGTVTSAIAKLTVQVPGGSGGPVTSRKLSGKVEYYASAQGGVPGVSLNLTEGVTRSTSSGAHGSYTIDGPEGTENVAVTLTPSLATDVPVANGVSTADITLIRRHVLGIAPLYSAYKVMAGDVNGSDSVTTADITLIRQLILGTATNFSTGLWRFVPSDEAFSDPTKPWTASRMRRYATLAAATLSGQDFKAIKLGDVNGSWKAPTVAPSSTGTAKSKAGVGKTQGHLSIGKVRTTVGKPVSIPVTLDGVDRLGSLQLTLSWDPATASFAGVTGIGLANLGPEHLGLARVSEGLVSLSWDSPTGLPVDLQGAGELIRLDLVPKPGLVTIGAINVAAQPTGLELTDGKSELSATVSPGWWVIGSESGDAVAGTESASLQITPAPGGTIRLEATGPSGATLTIEASADLATWTETQRLTGQGPGQPISVTPVIRAEERTRYWRIRAR